MMQKTINGSIFRKMIMAGASLLEQNKKLVDALNVFPVPDGDTGTNMFLTIKSASAEVNNCINNSMDSLCEAYSKGALRGARGNSGVITSQIVKGLTSVLGQAPEITTKVFAKAIQEGANVAYKAVTKPKEGTILTVIRTMAESAIEVAKKHADFEEFFKLVLDRGEEILQQTPEMLPVLKKAGVVDAGGRGLIVLFTGYYKAICGDETLTFNFDDPKPVQSVDDVIADINNLADIEFGYCTEFMIIHMLKKTTEADIDRLREKLMEIGDSVLCIGDLNLVKVHVHTNEPNRALGFALELGEIWNIKIENMLEQNRELKKNMKKVEELKPLGMVAVAPGEGLANLFTDLTVDQIIAGGQTMNPSAADIANAVAKVPAENVFVFPNNKNIILAAEQAKALSEKVIHVIPTRNVPEGIAASLAFNPEASVEENIENMTASIENVKAGSVTYAVRATHVDGFDLSVGEIIGLDDKAILAKGAEVSATTEDLIEKMVDENSVNITLFFGEDITEEDAEKLRERLSAKYPECEVTAIFGGQPVYYYIISVE
ncbi:MAG: DAK2 domain-containing protein [Firmicutes bacterium]|nr:DAK2 domain-containing protein [Bacillota bacterium]MDY3658700.1 DAK2 domain-containing protein [Eubacteriales bacterium]